MVSITLVFGKRCLEIFGELAVVVGEHRGLRDHAYFAFYAVEPVYVLARLYHNPAASCVPQQAYDFGVVGVADYDYRVALVGVHLYDAGDLSHVGAGGVLAGHSEGFQIFPALGRHPVGAEDENAVLSEPLISPSIGFSLL